MVSTEVAAAQPKSAEMQNVLAPDVNADLSDYALSNMSTFADISAMFPGGLVDGAAVLGDGFTLLASKDKDRLINVPCVLLEWEAGKNSEYENGFTIVRLATLDSTMNITGKYVFTDGSVGVHRQLTDFTNQYGRNHGMILAHGLRRSDYTVEVEGKTIPASTYYLDTSA